MAIHNVRRFALLAFQAFSNLIKILLVNRKDILYISYGIGNATKDSYGKGQELEAEPRRFEPRRGQIWG